jgi:glycosyltransferase involved in cell wall biosynthesis
MDACGSTGPEISASCVIPAWNASGTIERALRSVLLTPGIGEVIVVDDGSSDGTGNRVETLAAEAHLPVRLIRQDNAGVAAARNVGMQAVGLDWVTFLDADDEMLPEAITGKLAHLATCPDPDGVDAVHGSFLRGDTGAPGQFAVTRHRVDPDRIGRAGGFPGGVVSYIFRSNALRTTGGFRAELKMFEDFELILRFIAQGARVVGCTVPGFHRHYTVGSLSRGTAIAKRLQIERQFLSIAARDNLMSRSEIARRRLRNTARQLFNAVTGR